VDASTCFLFPVSFDVPDGSYLLIIILLATVIKHKGRGGAWSVGEGGWGGWAAAGGGGGPRGGGAGGGGVGRGGLGGGGGGPGRGGGRGWGGGGWGGRGGGVGGWGGGGGGGGWGGGGWGDKKQKNIYQYDRFKHSYRNQGFANLIFGHTSLI